MGQDSHSHSWNIVLLFVSTSRGNFFWFQNPLQTWQIPYEAMESFSSAKKVEERYIIFPSDGWRNIMNKSGAQDDSCEVSRGRFMQRA